ncbi:unnamed protein product [Urochloa decumbens]|uniref:BHLH domain-containing protein n=1 Tax=Urochloa decumbens TaxID=240449 RepID=A0ABC8ZLG9_9POAL
MDEVWCGLDLQHLQAGDLAGGGLHHPAPDLHLQEHDPFWPALADFLAGDTACFGVADIDLSGDGGKAVDDGMDASSFFADDHHLMTHHQEQQQQQQPVYSSSSLSSKRSLSIDSGGTSSTTFFPLDDAAAGALFSSSPSHPAADPFAAAGDDEALMLRAMMAVISSASPSSSESSSPALSQETSAGPAAVGAQPRPRGGSNVTVRSSSLAVAPEGTTSLASAAAATAAGGRQQEAAGSNNSSQVYHMMSERKRREKLNDSFHTLRSLLPPCSKKDKTTVLINAASFLKTLEAQVSELEEKNAKLERYVPREGATAAAAAAHRRAKVHISRSASDARQASLVVMVMVECDIVDLVLHVLECLRWTSGVSVLSVDADTYSPQALLKARANIKLHILDGDCWNEALFHEAMTKAVHDATSSPSSSSCAAPAPLVAAA